MVEPLKEKLHNIHAHSLPTCLSPGFLPLVLSQGLYAERGDVGTHASLQVFPHSVEAPVWGAPGRSCLSPYPTQSGRHSGPHAAACGGYSGGLQSMVVTDKASASVSAGGSRKSLPTQRRQGLVPLSRVQGSPGWITHVETKQFR